MAGELRQRSRTAAKPDSRETEKMIRDIQKNYGSHVITAAGQKARFKHLQTGIFTLDMALLGGLPEGLTTMIYGWESSGKTTLATMCAGRMQKRHPGSQIVYLDIEGTFDSLWAAKHGVDNDNLLLVQPETGEMALDIAEAAISASDCSLLVVDSLAMITPFKEVDSSVEDDFVGLQPRLIGKFLRKITAVLMKERARGHWPIIILINQWRNKIGVFRGDPRILPGGNAIKYAHSVGIEIKNREILGRDQNDNETVEKNIHSFEIRKSKIGTSLRNGEFEMIRNPANPLGEGFIDDAGTVVAFGRRMGQIVGEGGSHKTVNGLDEKFKTFDEIADYFYANMDFFEDFKNRLIGMQRAQYMLNPEGWY